jgi:iron complex outermembrane receptor protein
VAYRSTALNLKAGVLRYALLATAACVATAAHAQAAPDTQSSTVEEIVVTAQKREQSLQDVPISVTALTGQALVANRIQNVNDLNAVAPNLTVRPAAGGVALPSFSLRGVQSYGVALGSDKEVSVYLDGVYIGSATGSIFDIADLERIEVLKGPQGTLFGRNATAGAISIITKNPSGRFGVHQELTGGNYGQFRSRTSVNLPAWGPISAAVNFTHSQRRGDIENLGAGTVWNYTAVGQGLVTSPKWLGDKNTNAAGASVRFEPNDRFNMLYKFDWTEDHGTPEGVGQLALSPAALGGLPGAYVAAVLANQPNPGILTPISPERPDAVNNAFTTQNYNKAFGHNVTAQFHFNDHVSVKNILAYRSTSSNSTYPVGGYDGLIFPQAAVPALANLTAAQMGLPASLVPVIQQALQPLVGSPWLLYDTTTQILTKQWSEELQLNVDTRYLTLTSGLLHYHANTTSFNGWSKAPNALFFKPLPGRVIPANGLAPSIVTQNSNAFYTQAEVHVTRQVDVLGGYRITKDEKNASFTAPGVLSVSEYSNARPSYMLGVNYKPNSDTLLYTKYSTAYMSGGNSFGLAYEPETAASWEGGVKADWLDRRVRTNLSLFTVKYVNLQTATSGSLLTPPRNELPVVLVNSGDLRAKGFEFEGTLLPMKGLTFNAGVGYTDAQYLKVNPIIGTLDNTKPLYRPKWTANLSGQYDTAPVHGSANLSFRLDAAFRSSELLARTAPQLQNAVTSPARWTVNSRVALMHLPVQAGTAQVALWTRNLLDAKTPEFVTGLGFANGASYLPARTFGVDVTYDF